MKQLLLAFSLFMFPVYAVTEMNENSHLRKAYDLGWEIGYAMGSIDVICRDLQFDRYPESEAQILIKSPYKKLVKYAPLSKVNTFIEVKTKEFPKCAEILSIVD